jgi:hypothetical protein
MNFMRLSLMKAALAALDDAAHRKSSRLARFSRDVGFHRAKPVVSEAVPFLQRVFGRLFSHLGSEISQPAA